MIARWAGGRVGTAVLAAAAIAAAGPSARADEPADYPVKPIVLIVPFGPGGASDFAARLLQPRLSRILGQQVVVENHDGASGNIGMELAARQAPDGYTLFFGNVGTISVNPYVFVNLKLKPLEDFVPVSIVADAPGVMVANPAFPPSSIAELVRYCRPRPGRVTFASAGASSISSLEMESFAHQAGIRLIQVPYKGGAGAAIKDLLGGQVNLTMTSIGSVLGYIKAGRLKPLAVTTRQRLPSLPRVPTMPEEGFPGNVSSAWQGVFAPKGTPTAIVEKLRAAIAEAMADRTIRTRMADAGVTAVSSSSTAEFRQFLVEDAAKWKNAVNVLKVRVD